ncbi:MAG TPA: response regulator transcription factor [Actinocrinis sp.]|jgi:two-component system response regulator MprA|uniref:response regulator transcription factor n=1 Tax=Actinocrinis sp. TaxID=1920516 RepID=UPI002DDDA8F4|nr:response regulator transcription factor [Actinocrinis sp.]HEV3169129.1 response regulator transcription factor [Actinocrinis sp.]
MPASPGRILVVDDEPTVRENLRIGLEFEGYSVAVAEDGVAALAQVGAAAPDLVIMDVMMPRMDGLTACRRLRARDPATPILMLTARNATGDQVVGLDTGADDYLTKPFDFDALLARIRALLRRHALLASAASTAAMPGERDRLVYADLTMDRITHEVWRGPRLLELTRTEYDLLETFLNHPRQVLTREQLIRAIWGVDFSPASNPIDVYVMYLRRKTESDDEPRLIQTVRGVGYVLRSAP